MKTITMRELLLLAGTFALISVFAVLAIYEGGWLPLEYGQ
jgi:hypothetical protein